MSKILEIQGLKKYFGASRGVENVSFHINEGEVFGFIGPNGSGKSTTIRSIMNLINKNSGSILYDNKELVKNDTKAYETIGYLPSENDLYTNMTVDELIKYNASFYSFDVKSKAYDLAKKLNVDLKKKICELSLGNIKKVGFVVALMHSPKLVIMDEATSGLDPLVQEEVYQIIQEEKAKGTTFLFSSHNLSEVKKICDTVGIIKEGEIIKVASIEELISTSYYKIRIYTKENLSLDYKLISHRDDEYIYLYQDNINDLLEELHKYKLDKVYIEEPSLEEIFIHYYR